MGEKTIRQKALKVADRVGFACGQLAGAGRAMVDPILGVFGRRLPSQMTRCDAAFMALTARVGRLTLRRRSRTASFLANDDMTIDVPALNVEARVSVRISTVRPYQAFVGVVMEGNFFDEAHWCAARGTAATGGFETVNGILGFRRHSFSFGFVRAEAPPGEIARTVGNWWALMA
ncbi:hypothetical protein [Mesorhizobium sp. ES1-4]|uniref:hypothetical protein n=1 Tax=Mesorhizobium sp. ES1-4 TaxID=2876627 RepID=UPI001CCD4A15|nr:hypothetical protein [Mesorhizobium sp. ES1-4]MBZ9795729.1 hypothetical protein [Mesorhizobium sp. ES1-4]